MTTAAREDRPGGHRCIEKLFARGKNRRRDRRRRGIGSAITERLCGLGARVIQADVVDRVESAAKEWARKGYQTSAVKLDVTNSAEVEKAASALNKEFGAVDILVANAGVAYEAPTATHSDEDCIAV
jgi:NADP-dependent 3-hydroxy acid dehydrogenase YdfG